jgi:hypothetical protein
MAKKKTTTSITSIILIVLGLMVLLYGLNLQSACTLPKQCLGWDAINPLCQADATVQNIQSGYCMMAFDAMKWVVVLIGAIITVMSFRRLAK